MIEMALRPILTGKAVWVRIMAGWQRKASAAEQISELHAEWALGFAGTQWLGYLKSKLSQKNREPHLAEQIKHCAELSRHYNTPQLSSEKEA